VLLRSFIELITPEECLGCGDYNGPLCTNCVVRRGRGEGVCYNCGRRSARGQTCELCRGGTRLDGASVGTYYDGAAKELILQLKFHRKQAAAEAAAKLVLGALPGGLGANVVTSVPVSPGRLRERGYNQSELVARRVARELRLPYRALLWRATSGHQLGVGRRARFEQVKDALHSRTNLSGDRVLIVDDVITTGATLAECARVLSDAGAMAVWGAAVARH
jgi:competence protein ComFC